MIRIFIVTALLLVGCKMQDKKLDTNCTELNEYIHMLEEENQMLGSMLAECE